ncbi:MAG: WbqC family protein [Bacteroidia bacterium]
MFLDCFGSLNWWVNFISAEERILETNHSFQKQSSLSQYQINGANGIIKCSVPTVKESRRGPFLNVQIADENWQMEQWRSIKTAYLKSPFFIYYDFKLEPLFRKKHQSLYEFNKGCFEVILDCLKIDTDVKWESKEAYYKEVPKYSLEVYPQVFDERNPFNGDVAILDLIFNLGPEARDYLSGQTTSS